MPTAAACKHKVSGTHSKQRPEYHSGQRQPGQRLSVQKTYLHDLQQAQQAGKKAALELDVARIENRQLVAQNVQLQKQVADLELAALAAPSMKITGESKLAKLLYIVATRCQDNAPLPASSFFRAMSTALWFLESEELGKIPSVHSAAVAVLILALGFEGHAGTKFEQLARLSLDSKLFRKYEALWVNVIGRSGKTGACRSYPSPRSG